MANIVINSICNQSCSYCFAKDYMETNQNVEMNLQEFKFIVQWLQKSNIRQFGIIGGEPTLHSQFDIIINYLKYLSETVYPCSTLIFTNGTTLIEKEKIFEDCNVLININSPIDVGEKNFLKTKNGLIQISQNPKIQIQYGINLYPTLDFNFFFDLIKDLPIKPIRVSYVVPCNSKIDKNIYYKEGKKLFLSFVDKMIEGNYKGYLDCNYIPYCFFNEDELQKIKKVFGEERNFCHPALDFISSSLVIPCFGINKTIKYDSFENYQTLERYIYYYQMGKLSEKNLLGCNNCIKKEQFECQGGCLSFVSE